MERRTWTGAEKLKVVLEGLKGTVPLGELCARHGISQTQYYKWRDRLLSDGAKVFDYGGPTRAEERLRHQNERLKSMVGELTMELKKNDW
jgi:transposase-like protein